MVLEEDETFVDVLLWGSTDMEQEPIPEPAQIIRDTTAIDIRAGFKFTAILTDDDLIYTTGDTDWWNINKEPVEDLVIWHELQNRNVTKIVCGSNFIAALTGDKKIYTWGKLKRKLKERNWYIW
jgi:alpha-tubulin suppressor-like RCC1 family protein